jgi:GNAT superfamily N-acetyltransferase
MARVHEKLSAPEALPFVALRKGVLGMALAEPGRFDGGSGTLDPSLLHLSMLIVRPAAQRTGVGLSLLLHVLRVARSLGYERVGVWIGEENTSASPSLRARRHVPTAECVPGRRWIQYTSATER